MRTDPDVRPRLIESADGRIGVTAAADTYDLGQAIFADWLFKAKEHGHHILRRGNRYEAKDVDAFVAGVADAMMVVGISDFQIVWTGAEEIVVQSKDAFIFMRRDASPGKEIWEVNIHADEAACSGILTALGMRLTEFHSSAMHWWYMNHGSPSSIRVALNAPPTFTPEMYPMKPFAGDPLGYMKRFYESNASILFLLGPPGTGKTSLIRQFLWLNELSAFVTYDEKVLADDGMFIRFLNPRNRHAVEDNADIMVLEDVTELLQKREMDKNALMARFLNVSDGLIQLPTKKLIFTTNLASLKDVDPAMLRPGRCHDVVEMRPLFYEESVEACKAAGLPIPLEKRDYLMSELYNQGLKDRSRISASSIGFA